MNKFLDSCIFDFYRQIQQKEDDLIKAAFNSISEKIGVKLNYHWLADKCEIAIDKRWQHDIKTLYLNVDGALIFNDTDIHIESFNNLPVIKLLSWFNVIENDGITMKSTINVIYQYE